MVGLKSEKSAAGAAAAAEGGRGGGAEAEATIMTYHSQVMRQG
jgi:hypothetical protein